MGERVSPAERTRRAKASRAEAIANTRPTTRPGSERTGLQVGDRVRVRREMGRTGTWARYDGRIGWVASVNTQRFPNGATYVEVGVAWNRAADSERASAEVWFRADEVIADAAPD